MSKPFVNLFAAQHVSDRQIARRKHLAHVAFGREVLRKVTDAILPLADGGAGTAFYCVHPVTGVATDFRFLAQMLGNEQNFYGIQTPTANRNAEFAGSIETISRHYVNRLIEFQPTGNFALGGHSVGAVIALEMAQQLRALGRNVSLVIVLDGELFNTGAEISAYNPMYWLKLLFNVPAWIRDFLLVEFTFGSFVRTLLRKVIVAGKTILAKVNGKGCGDAVEGFINLKSCTADHAAFMKTLYENQFKYVPTQYLGRVLVCTAKTQPLTHLRQVEAPWRKVALNSEVLHFDGTHTSFIHAPTGQALAAYLTQKLVETNETAEVSHVAAVHSMDIAS